MTPEGWAAMEEAKTVAVELHRVRRTQFGLAARRREAVVRARQQGVTYRKLASELGISVGAIQQLNGRVLGKVEPPVFKRGALMILLG